MSDAVPLFLTLTEPPDPMRDSRPAFIRKADAFTQSQKAFGDHANAEVIPALNALMAGASANASLAAQKAAEAAASAGAAASEALRALEAAKNASESAGTAAREAVEAIRRDLEDLAASAAESARRAEEEAAFVRACADDLEKAILEKAAELLLPEKVAGAIRDLTAQAEDIMARLADAQHACWTLDRDVRDGETLEFPDGVAGYFPGHHAVSLLWDGIDCHEGCQFEELGDPGVRSRAVRLLFDAHAGSELSLRIAGHVAAPGAAESGVYDARLNHLAARLDALDAAAVRYAAQS